VAAPLADGAELSARVVAVSDEAAAGYLPILFALRALRRADLAALDALAEPYARPDADDAGFYARARLVDHLDARAQACWREFTGRFVAAGAAVLDLMTSHDSHLPADAHPGRVAGLGMNATELDRNPLLSERVVHDLNADPRLPWDDARFDVVLCALSIEYLTQPEAVLRAARRVLRPGGTCLITFSERWFPPKAVLPWPALMPGQRLAWVLRHLERAGFAQLHTESLRGLPRPADDKYIRQTSLADPLYAVWGCVP
jgi:SAM-dependent methyltransferase